LVHADLPGLLDRLDLPDLADLLGLLGQQALQETRDLPDLLGQLDLRDFLGLPHPLTLVAKQISLERATPQGRRPRLSNVAGGDRDIVANMEVAVTTTKCCDGAAQARCIPHGHS
jgi:hypothetical protein